MFTYNAIAFGFLELIFLVLILPYFSSRGLDKLVKLGAFLLILSSLYCFFAGLWMATGWVDPLADVNTFEIPKHHKRGLALLMMKYLPYVLIAFSVGGVFLGFIYLLRGKNFNPDK